MKGLKKYQQMVTGVTTQEISDWLEAGDYALLAVTRLVIHEDLQAGKATDEQKELIAALDAQMKAAITKKQLAYFAADFPEMPFTQWWG